MKIRENINDTTRKLLKMISNVYKKWIHLFREKKSIKIFFKHKSWNHEIKLKLKKQFTFEFIYVLFEIKFNVFKKYLNTNLKKNSLKNSNHRQNIRFFLHLKKTTNFVYVLIIENWTTLRLKTNIYYLTSTNFKTNYKKQNISSKSICVKHTIWFVWKKKWKTIFKIRYKHYEYTIMLFKFTNVLTTC